MGDGQNKHDYLCLVGTHSNEIHIFSRKGELMATLANSSYAKDMYWGTGFALSDKAEVFFVGYGAQHLVKFSGDFFLEDPSSCECELLNIGDEADRLLVHSKPEDMRFLNGFLYVASLEGQILRFGTDGRFLGAFASHHKLNYPWQMVIGPNGNFYITSSNPCTILEFSSTTGEYIQTFMEEHLTGIEIIAGIIFGDNNDSYIASSCGIIQKYEVDPKSNSARFLCEVKAEEDTIWHAAEYFENRIYVSNAGRDCIDVYDCETLAMCDTFLDSTKVRVPNYVKWFKFEELGEPRASYLKKLRLLIRTSKFAGEVPVAVEKLIAAFCAYH